MRAGFIEKYLPSILLCARVFVCVCIWDLYILVMFSYLKRSEEDFRSPGAGVVAICDSSDTRTWIWTQVLYKSSKCSYLLNPLFSHINGFIYLFVFKFYTGGNIYQNNVSVSKNNMLFYGQWTYHYLLSIRRLVRWWPLGLSLILAFTHIFYSITFVHYYWV